MNDFQLYHNLCTLAAQLEPYAGESPLFAELKALTDQFSSRTYRVAVIGEFKRGKSSLVNALLGTEILPTDILPTTAVINRIVYALEQKIVIHFKNGEVRESTIDDLAAYTTKLDKEKEEFAETIREIIVHYPSVFGQNHIELIDTPGLNDNESMTETTLNILGDIDTAIVVISATMPLSITEQKLICDLIRQTDIYNLAFAVTFIDRVSDDEEDQDRVVELIKSRLSQDTFRYFCDTAEDDKLFEKARRILSQPNVYAVSSKQAIQGFIKGRNDLIEKSRFAHFKYHLSALLTANQEKDRLLKIKRICAELESHIPEWVEGNSRQIAEDIRSKEALCVTLDGLHNSTLNYLNESLLQLEEKAEGQRDSVIRELTNSTDLSQFLIRFFIRHLASIRCSQFGEATLSAALQQGCLETNQFMALLSQRLTLDLDALATAALADISGHYKAAGYALPDLSTPFVPPVCQQTPVPFVVTEDPILDAMSNLYDECVPHISNAISTALDTFRESLEDQQASRRLLIMQYHDGLCTVLENARTRLSAEIDFHQKSLQQEKITTDNMQRQIAATTAAIAQLTG